MTNCNNVQQIDRIIDEGELNDPETDELKVYYLVKWNNTFYDGSTWESEDDVEKVCCFTSHVSMIACIVTDMLFRSTNPRLTSSMQDELCQSRRRLILQPDLI
jgi:hypothetical protein